MSKHKIVVLLFFVVSLPPVSPNSVTWENPASHSWPEVKPLTRQYSFPDALHAVVDLSLVDGFGKKLYALHCRPGALIVKPSETNNVPNDTLLGDFGCHVHSLYERDKYGSLLIDDPLDNDESHSRGEFYFYQLQGDCLEYPEWGKKRSFRFRGMRLEFELTDIHFAGDPPPGRLASFGFKVDVTPDQTALSAISEPPAFLIPTTEPGKALRDPRFASCGKPMVQHVPGSVTEEYVRDLGLQPPYPAVSGMTKKLQIDPSHEGYRNPPFFTTEPVGRFAQVQIADPNGKPIYNFECTAYRIVGEKTPQIAGDGLTCGLFIAGKNTNLLLDSVDPYSRMTPAIIRANQLQGPAANNPEWGSTRHFSLRGFSLSLFFANQVFGKDEFRNVTLVRSELTIEIEPDPNALTPVAKPPVSPYPFDLPPGSAHRIMMTPAQ